MATTYGFRACDDWWFNRLDDGTVQIVQTQPGDTDRVLQTVMFDAYTWGLIVGRMGSNKTLDLMRSMGLPDPGTPEADMWVNEHIVSAYEEAEPQDDQDNPLE